MKLVYIITEPQTLTSKYPLHLPDKNDKPICGRYPFRGRGLAFAAKPTCKKCLKILEESKEK